MKSFDCRDACRLARCLPRSLLLPLKPSMCPSSAASNSRSYNNDNKGLIMMWFEGYYTEEDEPATIDFGKMAGHLAQILIECEANPDKSVLEVSEDAMDD